MHKLNSSSNKLRKSNSKSIKLRKSNSSISSGFNQGFNGLMWNIKPYTNTYKKFRAFSIPHKYLIENRLIELEYQLPA